MLAQLRGERWRERGDLIVNANGLTFFSSHMQVDAARRSVSRQYILITPNAIEGRARLDKDVKIIRLVIDSLEHHSLYRISFNKANLSRDTA